jgi:hypothetical protein
MDDEWPETPKDERTYAMRYDRVSEKWSYVEVRDLKAGDVFRMYSPRGMQLRTPPQGGRYAYAHGAAKAYVMFAHANARQAVERGEGYGVDCTWGELTLAEALKMGTQ